MFLNHVGLALGTQHVLTVRGRKSGKPRSTPVSLLYVDGSRYVVTGGTPDWVRNARARGRGMLTRGRRTEQVALVELPIDERAAILREFPKQVPHGTSYFELLLGVPINAEALAAAAPRCPVFRIDTIVATDAAT
jgi:deazaflavin-dependent oxidoreductase (nitroreductase family)